MRNVYQTGDVLGGVFKVIGTLGGGAFGLVLQVEWLLDGREYALKMFRATAAGDQVQRELRALQAVNHPNINRVVWAGTLEANEWYLVTELVQGQSLRTLIDAQHPIPDAEVVRLGGQLLDALIALHPNAARIAELEALPELTENDFRELQDLHATGWVHRDIKPENLILNESGDLVLIDFGIASRVGSEVLTKSRTDGYTPPDADNTRWSPSIDLFATGAVMFELSCGELPYSLDALEPVDPQGSSPEMGDSFADFLRTACAESKEDRFASAVAMRSALQAVEEGLRSSVAPPTARGQPTRGETATEPLAEYRSWVSRPLPGAGGASPDVLLEALVDIVASEGPVLCERLYGLYVGASGDPGVASVKRHLNRATYRAVSEGHLSQVEPLGGGQIDKTVYTTETEPVVVRDRGPRRIREIPPSEVREVATRLSGRTEGFLAADLTLVESAYDFGDLDWWDSQYLADCLGLEVDPLAAPGRAPIPDREAYITDRFIEHARDLNIDHLQVAESVWDDGHVWEEWAEAAEGELSPRRHLGYLEPIPHKRPLVFCPERLVRVTATLSDQHLVWAIDTILFVLDLEITHLDKPLNERLEISSDLLAAAGEGAMALFNDVLLTALDFASD